MRRFRDRNEAGHELAMHLREFAGRPDVVVLALPRGGVPVAAEIAATLGVALDVLVVRKIGVPWNPEYAVGALASGGLMVLDDVLMAELGMTREDVEPVIREERIELTRREELYHAAREFPDLRGKIVVLVDDGLATGWTMQAAVRLVRTKGPARIVVAAPVASIPARDALARLVDRVVCVLTPDPLVGVGMWYDDFSPPTDGEIVDMLSHEVTASQSL